jgi:hypothetical protein
MGDAMRKVWLVAATVLAGPAMAAPKNVLVEALRQETSATRAMLRDASDFCKEAVLPTTGRRDQTRCADKMVIAEEALTQQAVKDAWKELRSAEFMAVASGMLSLEEGRSSAGKAIPLFINFLSALDAAERPAKNKRAAK